MQRYLRLLGVLDLVRLSLALIAFTVLTGLSTVHAAEQKQVNGKVSQDLILPCDEAKPGGPEEVVRRLYQNRPFMRDDLRLGKANRKILQSYFDDRLSGLLEKYLKCDTEISRCPGHPDIFDDGNPDTWKTSDLRICAMTGKLNMVQVQYKNFDSPESVAYLLSKGKSGWRIANIYYVGKARPFDPEQGDAWSMLDTFSDFFESQK